MNLRIALAGNPNSGKTTLFNALTGSNQFVGNWPGVTVEKKEGRLRHHDGVTVVDLPGIYSLSPYTTEEVVARNFLVHERPDVILNIVDGSNLERNLYLSTQLTELGIPVVMAINMMDVVRKNGDRIDTAELARHFGCQVVTISALKGEGVLEAADAAIEAAQTAKPMPMHIFSGAVEHAIAHIEEAVLHDLPAEQQRWYAIKIFERDEKVKESLHIDEKLLAHMDTDIAAAEKELGDNAESIITGERYVYVAHVMKSCYKKQDRTKLSVSDKIDRVVMNRFAALPIFALVMFLVYYIAVSTVGTWVTDFTNDGLFGDGFHFLGIGRGKYEAAVTEYADETLFASETLRPTILRAVNAEVVGADEILAAIDDRDYFAFEETWGAYGPAVIEHLAHGSEATATLLTETFDAILAGAPAPDGYGAWVPGVGVLAERGLNKVGAAEWLTSLIVEGIIGGVGAVLGFVPQMLILFLMLAFLEACGYMARIAFVLDRFFRRFGLSGKSFIPMLVGIGCGVPGVMASRTIENERDRRMTVMTTTFMPCSAKLPIIALISTVLFGGAWWVAPSAYFLGIAAIAVSGIILKKTPMFAGEPAPFIMELPDYHMPSVGNLLRSTWERGWSFIKKAGTVILLATLVIWAGSKLGFTENGFGFSVDMEIADSILGRIGNAFKWVFAPLGFGSAEATVATFMGLLAKEEIVAVFGVLDFMGMTRLAGYSFLIFNLLCAPCFAAIGAIRSEMKSHKWFALAIAYQCIFAYVIAFIVYRIGALFTAPVTLLSTLGFALALLLLAGMIFLLLYPKKQTKRDK
ncbi:MAG: ferrous iron transporter B [Clostridia bacterium]|nr:ferrous iron transporter B [Clostridia bacterium]